MVTDVLLAAGLVVIVNVVVVALPKTVTLDGTVATLVLLLVKLITAPLAGAWPFRITVPVDEFPPSTEVGLKLSELSVAEVTVRLVVLVLLP
jgi:hypothetical protein